MLLSSCVLLTFHGWPFFFPSLFYIFLGGGGHEHKTNTKRAKAAFGAGVSVHILLRPGGTGVSFSDWCSSGRKKASSATSLLSWPGARTNRMWIPVNTKRNEELCVKSKVVRQSEEENRRPPLLSAFALLESDGRRLRCSSSVHHRVLAGKPDESSETVRRLPTPKT